MVDASKYKEWISSQAMDRSFISLDDHNHFRDCIIIEDKISATTGRNLPKYENLAKATNQKCKIQQM
jgi:hypoxanthine-guanine phosphoribosyltransferase